GAHAAARPVVSAAAITTRSGLARRTKPSTTTAIPSRTSIATPKPCVVRRRRASVRSHEGLGKRRVMVKWQTPASDFGPRLVSEGLGAMRVVGRDGAYRWAAGAP